MSLYILLLVFTAAILHASWNLLAKKTKGGIPFIWLQYVAGTILCIPFLFFQKGCEYILYSQPLLWFSLGSAVLHLGYFIVLQKGYRSADLSVVYPLARGSGPLFSSMAAILFLQEHLKLSSTIGLFLIIAGVFVITGLSFKKERNRTVMTGIIYGVLTGFFIGLYTINDAIAVKRYAVTPLILTLGTNLFSTVLLSPFVFTQKDEIKREIREH